MAGARRLASIFFALGGVAFGLYFFLRGRGVKHFADRMSFRITPNLGGVMIRSDYIALPLTLTVVNRSAERLRVRIHSAKCRDTSGEIGDLQASTGSVLHSIMPHAETNMNVRMNFPTLATLTRIGFNLTQGVVSSIAKGGGVSSWLSHFGSQAKSKLESWVQTLSVSVALEVDGVPLSTTIPILEGGALGLVSTKKRPIGSKADYAHLVPAIDTVKHRSVRIMRGTTGDTADLIRRLAQLYSKDVQRLARTLKGDTLQKTLSNIYSFVYRYIAYVKDASTREEVRTPLRTLHDQRGDCDCYSTLIASLLESLNVPYRVRLAAYKGRNYFQHVYIVVNDRSAPAGYWTIDPVVEGFNYEEPYTFHRDY